MNSSKATSVPRTHVVLLSPYSLPLFDAAITEQRCSHALSNLHAVQPRIIAHWRLRDPNIFVKRRAMLKFRKILGKGFWEGDIPLGLVENGQLLAQLVKSPDRPPKRWYPLGNGLPSILMELCA